MKRNGGDGQEGIFVRLDPGVSPGGERESRLTPQRNRFNMVMASRDRQDDSNRR